MKPCSCLAVASRISEAGKVEVVIASGDKAINPQSGIALLLLRQPRLECLIAIAHQSHFNAMTSVLQLR